ncbi:MAG: hypothetical protein WCP85_11855 [Mariniphaga sp.]
MFFSILIVLHLFIELSILIISGWRLATGGWQTAFQMKISFQNLDFKSKCGWQLATGGWQSKKKRLAICGLRLADRHSKEYIFHNLHLQPNQNFESRLSLFYELPVASCK